MLVQKLRLQRGWSQEQLAELSGLSVRTIQRIERGLPASNETLKSLASVFEIDFSTLQATQEPAMTTQATSIQAPYLTNQLTTLRPTINVKRQRRRRSRLSPCPQNSRLLWSFAQICRRHRRLGDF